MKLSPKTRGFLALVTAFFITEGVNTLSFISSIPWRLLFGWSKFQPFTGYQWLWSRLIHEHVMKRQLDVTVVERGYAQAIERVPGVIDVIVVNHPPSTLIASLFHFVRDRVAKVMATVVKSELMSIRFWGHPNTWSLWGPVFGWAGWGMWGMFPIDRKNPAKALVVLRNLVARFAEKMPIFIFPDSSRPTPKKIAADIQKFQSTIPDVAEWLTETLVPRASGTYTLVETVRALCQANGESYRVRIIDVTCWSSNRAKNVVDADMLVGATLYVDVAIVEDADIPDTLEGFQVFLVERWKRKHRLFRGEK